MAGADRCSRGRSTGQAEQLGASRCSPQRQPPSCLVAGLSGSYTFALLPCSAAPRGHLEEGEPPASQPLSHPRTPPTVATAIASVQKRRERPPCPQAQHGEINPRVPLFVGVRQAAGPALLADDALDPMHWVMHQVGAHMDQLTG